MPKKPARNAFWFFMAEWKTKEERNGRSFPNGFRDVQACPRCNEAWRALTAEEKAPYVNKAKKAKANPEYGKQTNTGEFIDLVEKEEQNEYDFKLNMESHIRNIISEAKKYKQLQTLRFSFIHMNHYYMRKPDTGPVDYCPAEFAIGEFSIQNGLSRHYHEIIRTTLHLGYTREAMEVSEKTHMLNWDLPIGEGDWAIMYHKVKNFLEPLQENDKLPPIYASKKISHLLPSLFRRMADAVGQNPGKFVVYSLESLYGHILRAVSDHPESRVLSILAETQLEKEIYAYTPNIECDYHKTLDGKGQFCSLSVIRQWAFEFCDQSCKPLGVKMIPGVHCPASIEKKFKPNLYNASFQSAINDCNMGVLSATGVSQRHRISVSERSRDEDLRRRNNYERIEIIDHSLREPEKRPPSPEPAPIAAPIPQQPPRAPSTMSQALIGVHRVPPVFNGENFPAIGGRGFPRQQPMRRPEGPIWSHRGNKNSDSD
ncbi:protein maelstrom 2 [Venturia canescens]|uniref:protein maelstrom 2 n=1 Tax=Venturia canescens TaxID=32260 RepID=UPI001C9C9AC4|nr:protein maelstrom 2 [Venturia canescens]